MANVLGKVHTINARETTFFNANRTYDRIITDIPSFENRWPGTQGAGEVIDNVNAVIHVMNNNMSADGTATLSMTGIAQEKFNIDPNLRIESQNPAGLIAARPLESSPDREGCKQIKIIQVDFARPP